MSDHRRAADISVLARLDATPAVTWAIRVMFAGLVTILGWTATRTIEGQDKVMEAQNRLVATINTVDRNQAVMAQRLDDYDRRLGNVERKVWRDDRLGSGGSP